MRRLAALLILVLALASGCSQRARLNPFDPANPGTGGRPAGFEAVAGNQSVLLRWAATSAPGLVGYQVFRRVEGDTGFRALTGVLSPATTSHQDFGLLNGVEHRYRLLFVFGTGPGGLPAEDFATPGPLRPWIAEYGAARLVRLSADGRRIAQALTPPPGGRPYAVDVSPVDGWVWSVNPGSDVLVYVPGTGSWNRIGQGIVTPVSVAVSRSDSAAWVGDAGADLVEHLRPSGARLDPGPYSGLDYPGDLALDDTRDWLWVVEQEGQRVRRYDRNGALAATAVLPRPSRVAADAAAGEAWVTSLETGRVFRLAFTGAILDSVTDCVGPIGVAVDAGRDRIWVADAAGNQVLALRRDGTVEFRVTGQEEPREIAVDPVSGEAWVTLAGAVARLSPAGTEILRVGGLDLPCGIALDDVRGRAAPPPPAPAGPLASRRR